MRALNKVQLIGNLGADPDVRYTQAGDAVATLSIATSESWADKQTGEAQERTEWHRCVLWRRVAEIAGEYLRKGARVFVEGKLQTRKWQDQSGQDRYTTEIQVRDLIMLDGARSDQPSQPAATRHGGNGQHRSGPPRSQGSQAPYRGAGRQSDFQAPPQDFDNDIPF
jgi:single-strand DNA-binding protein